MADVEVTYKGNTIGSLNDSGTLTLQTAGKYLEDDVGIGYTSPGGGGGSAVEPNDVNFYDYDGTLLYSYSAADFANLSAMPANPSHTGLTAQGWNWALATAKTYVATHGKLGIGQMYVTDDGKTRLYIHLPPEGTRREVSVRFTQTVANGVEVDWGDGSTPETFTGTTADNYSHTYADGGDYVITLKVLSGSVSFDGSSYYNILGSNSNNASNYSRRRSLQKAEIGSNVTSIGDYAFANCYLMKSITIPSTVTSIGSNALYYCASLQAVTIPSNVTSIGGSACKNCYSMRIALLPPNITDIAGNEFQNCYGLPAIAIPSGVTSIGTSAFSACYPLTTAMIPVDVTSLGNSAFSTCYSLIALYLFPTTPPTIGTNTFSNTPSDAVFYVPYSADHSVLNAYKTATNWSSFANQIVEMAA